MADHVRTRGGSVLLQRLGNLRMGEQSRWGRAPASRGLWAFPWPLFEMFFAYHQYTDAAPIRLRTDRGKPVHRSGWVDSDGNPPPAHLSVAEIVADDSFTVRDGFHAELESWVRDVGRRVVRKRQFWYDGDLYTHLSPRGDILPLDEWRRMPAATFAQALRRSGGTWYFDSYGGRVYRGRTVSDNFEVFVPDRGGRVHGRHR